MGRRVTGAALKSRVVANIRVWLATDYGLPIEQYVTENVWAYGIGSDMQPIMTVQLRREATGATIQVSDIYPADNGDIHQQNAYVEMR